MPSFGARSKRELSTCCDELQAVLGQAIKYCDFSVIKGHRGESEQNALCDQGFSKLRYPNSKHNTSPSKAVDVIPYPFTGWDDIKRFIRVLSFIQGVGYGMRIPLRIGGDWNGDYQFNESFPDWPHIEIIS